MTRASTKPKSSPEKSRGTRAASKEKDAETAAIVASEIPSVWPDVLTLAQAAAYLQISESQLNRIVDLDGPPGRKVDNEWRFPRAAILRWLERPSMKEVLLRQAGSWKDDPYGEEMVKDIYRRRGRPMVEETE